MSWLSTDLDSSFSLSMNILRYQDKLFPFFSLSHIAQTFPRLFSLVCFILSAILNFKLFELGNILEKTKGYVLGIVLCNIFIIMSLRDLFRLFSIFWFQMDQLFPNPYKLGNFSPLKKTNNL